jgi:protein-S-isoprenylcysteine O-methyltransferase Ste14
MMSKTRGPIPPVILLACILSEIGLHYKLPLTEIIPAPWHWFGIAMIVVGVLIIIVPASAFARADTTIKPFQDSSQLVVTGMYRYTRNPMYVGMVIILLGVAVLLGDLSPFIMPILFVPILNSRVIRHEEEMLEERFGDEYRELKKTVRRWV